MRVGSYVILSTQKWYSRFVVSTKYFGLSTACGYVRLLKNGAPSSLAVPTTACAQLRPVGRGPLNWRFRPRTRRSGIFHMADTRDSSLN